MWKCFISFYSSRAFFHCSWSIGEFFHRVNGVTIIIGLGTVFFFFFLWTDSFKTYQYYISIIFFITSWTLTENLIGFWTLFFFSCESVLIRKQPWDVTNTRRKAMTAVIPVHIPCGWNQIRSLLQFISFSSSFVILKFVFIFCY